MKNHSRALAYLITTLIGLAMAVAVLLSRGGFSQPDAETMYTVLCDACFIPGIVLTCMGVLMLVAHDGFFDIMSYGAYSLITLFTPFRKAERHKRYYDYKVEKAAKRQKPNNAMLWVGLAFLAVAGLCLLLMSTNGYAVLPEENPGVAVEATADPEMNLRDDLTPMTDGAADPATEEIPPAT